MSDIGLVTPLLRDEQFFDPVTGRGTLRFLQYLEELRASANATTTIINQEVEQFKLQTQQVATLAKVLSDDIAETRAATEAAASNLQSALSELSKQLENVAQLAVSFERLNATVNELSKRVDDVEQLANGH